MEAELTQKFFLNCLQRNKKFCESRCELKCKQKGGWAVMGDREKYSERKNIHKTWEKKGKRKDQRLLKHEGKLWKEVDELYNSS